MYKTNSLHCCTLLVVAYSNEHITWSVMEDVPTAASSTDHVLDMAENLVTQCKKMVSSADEFFQPKEKWDAGKQFSREHPVAAFFIIILAAMSIIPVACFCAFAVCMTLVIFGSCLFFEGNYHRQLMHKLHSCHLCSVGGTYALNSDFKVNWLESSLHASVDGFAGSRAVNHSVGCGGVRGSWQLSETQSYYRCHSTLNSNDCDKYCYICLLWYTINQHDVTELVTFRQHFSFKILAYQVTTFQQKQIWLSITPRSKTPANGAVVKTTSIQMPLFAWICYLLFETARLRLLHLIKCLWGLLKTQW